MAIIETAKLPKYYDKVRGIEALDLAVDQGEVFGFLGPSDADKTTTIRLFLEPRKALAASGIITAAMYIINFIVPLLSHSFSWLAEISFFHHYNAVQIVRSGALDWTAVIIFSATFLVCSAASIIIFRRRDLSV